MKASRALSIATVSAVFGHAAAQEFPARPVHRILSQPAGSSPDISAPLVAGRTQVVLVSSAAMRTSICSRSDGQSPS